ncbi:hypothetical protein Tco_0670529, partial [Tanacetum coccineum]
LFLFHVAAMPRRGFAAVDEDLTVQRIENKAKTSTKLRVQRYALAQRPEVAPVTADKPRGTTQVVTRGYLMINCKDERSVRCSGSEGSVQGSGSKGSTRFRVYKVASQSQAATWTK